MCICMYVPWNLLFFRSNMHVLQWRTSLIIISPTILITQFCFHSRCFNVLQPFDLINETHRMICLYSWFNYLWKVRTPASSAQYTHTYTETRLNSFTVWWISYFCLGFFQFWHKGQYQILMKMVIFTHFIGISKPFRLIIPSIFKSVTEMLSKPSTI